jgi:hypothetical protein
MTTLEPGPDFTINNRWVIGVKIASGGFGAIYKGMTRRTTFVPNASESSLK